MHPAPANDQHHQDDRRDRHHDQDDDEQPKAARSAPATRWCPALGPEGMPGLSLGGAGSQPGPPPAVATTVNSGCPLHGQPVPRCSPELVGTLVISNPGVVLLLHRDRDVCVPGNVNLVADLNLIEHSRIDDAPAVFPSVRARKGDRRCALIDTGDSSWSSLSPGTPCRQVAPPAPWWWCRWPY